MVLLPWSCCRTVALSAREVKDALDRDTVLVDLRSPEAYAGAFIPGSLAIPLEMLQPMPGIFSTMEQISFYT